jgi:hypothetical protein
MARRKKRQGLSAGMLAGLSMGALLLLLLVVRGCLGTHEVEHRRLATDDDIAQRVRETSVELSERLAADAEATWTAAPEAPPGQDHWLRNFFRDLSSRTWEIGEIVRIDEDLLRVQYRWSDGETGGGSIVLWKRSGDDWRPLMSGDESVVRAGLRRQPGGPKAADKAARKR